MRWLGKKEKYKNWSLWFAWYPVQVDRTEWNEYSKKNIPHHKEWVCGEMVSRRFVDTGNDMDYDWKWQYTLPGEEW